MLFVFFQIVLYFGCCFIGLMIFENVFFSLVIKEIMLVIGIFGIWWYGWWFIYVVWVWIYGCFVYLFMCDVGKKVWEDGWWFWYLYFMMIIYKEYWDIIEKVIWLICWEI